MFPTPNAALLNDAEEAEDFDARQKKWGDKYYNSPPLEVFVKAPAAVGSNWPTPMAGEADGGKSKRSGNPFDRSLKDEAQRWQTPAAAQGLGGHISRGGDRKDEPYLAGQVQQWRTPAGSDGEGGTMEMRPGADGKYKLRDHVAAWPTPAVSTSPEAPTDRPSDLRGAATAWPTPTLRDKKGPAASHTKGGRDLPGDASLFPTPNAMDGNRSGVEEDAEAWRRRAAEKARQGVNLHYHLNAAVDDFQRGIATCHCGAPVDSMGYPACKLPLQGEGADAYWARMEEHDRRWGRALEAPSLFPTPKTPTGGAESRGSRGSRGSGGEDLEAAVTKEEPWRTPNSRDWKGESAASWRERDKGDPTPTLPDQIRAMEDASPPSSPADPAPPTSRGGPRYSPIDPTSLPPSWVRSLLRGKPPAGLLDLGRRCAADPSTVVDDSTAIGSVCYSVRLFLRRKRLNPRFVEWMMGWPQGWTEHGPIGSAAFASWEMGSSLRPPVWPSGSYMSVWLEEARRYRRRTSGGTQGSLFP